MPATLSLTLGAPASFGAFTPGITKDYTATSDATITSSAGDAALSVSDPGHLTNGAFSLAEPLRVELAKSAWTAPTSNEKVGSRSGSSSSDRPAAHRQLQPDAHVHPVHDEPIGPSSPRGSPRGEVSA